MVEFGLSRLLVLASDVFGNLWLDLENGFAISVQLLNYYLFFYKERMSLAMFAAPFNEENSSADLLYKKRQQMAHSPHNSTNNHMLHNKTQKRFSKESFDVNKVNSMLETIHNKQKAGGANNDREEDGEDDEEEENNFHPPPAPQSAGVSKAIAAEHMTNMSTSPMFQTLGRAPQPSNNESDKLDLHDFHKNHRDANNAEFYQKMIPSYMNSQTNKPYYYNSSAGTSSSAYSSHSPPQQQSLYEDPVMKKLNYVISLLEDQQDEKTNNVTEEVVLYSFLGIFVIFIVDSFARVGKYSR